MIAWFKPRAPRWWLRLMNGLRLARCEACTKVCQEADLRDWGALICPRCASGERDAQIREAFHRQADNLAFVLNRVDLPAQWFEKFDRELEEDRAAMARLCRL